MRKSQVIPLAVVLLSAPVFADDSESISYGGTTLQPGDVIALRGGLGAVVSSRDNNYGHVGMYLGRDSSSREPTFFDFTTEKKETGDPQYSGRILGEKDFLQVSKDSRHPSFDVLRSPDAAKIHPEKLRQSARAKASSGDWTLSHTCATAVVEVLEQASDGQLRIPHGPLDALFATFRNPDETDLVRPDRIRNSGFQPVLEKYEISKAEVEAANRPIPSAPVASIPVQTGPSSADRARAGELRARSARLKAAVSRCEARVAAREIANCTVNLSWEGGRAVSIFEASSIAAQFDVEASRLDP